MVSSAGSDSSTRLLVTPGVAGVLIERGEILLTRRAAPSFFGKWCVPCGHIEPDETPQAAAARELREETGLDVRIGEPIFVYLSFQVPDKPVLGVWFEATRLGGKLRAGDDASEVRFVPLDAPPASLAFDGDRLLIEKLRKEREANA